MFWALFYLNVRAFLRRTERIQINFLGIFYLNFRAFPRRTKRIPYLLDFGHMGITMFFGWSNGYDHITTIAAD